MFLKKYQCLGRHCNNNVSISREIKIHTVIQLWMCVLWQVGIYCNQVTRTKGKIIVNFISTFMEADLQKTPNNLARAITRNEDSKRDIDTVNEDVEGRIGNMWDGQKQDESFSRNAAVSNTIQPICGSRGICHPTIKQVRWSKTLRNVTKMVCLHGSWAGF